MSDVSPGPNTPGGIQISMDVRWGDMDSFGHMNNTVYLRFFESTRIAYLEAMGIDLVRREGSTGPGLVAANINFRRQVRYPARLISAANVTAIGERSITFVHVLKDERDGVVVADGECVCVWMDYEKEKALPIPAPLLQEIARIEGSMPPRRK